MGILTGKADVVSNIPQFNSPAENWIQWHKDLKSNFGKKIANGLWLKAWRIRGNSSANTNPLREYMKKQGVEISSSAFDKVIDMGADVTDFIGDAFQVSKYAGIAIGVIILGGAAMIVYNLAKNPAQNAGLAARAFVTKGK